MQTHFSVRFVRPTDTHYELHHDVFNRSRPSHFFYVARGYFNAFNLLTSVFTACCFAAFFSKIGLVLFLGFGLLLGGCFFLARSQAHGLRITRRVPATVQEGTRLVIEYELLSSFPVPLSNWSCFDRFSGCKDQVLARVSFGEEVTPLASLRFGVGVQVEGAMGLHQLGPLTVKVRDPLGIFTFEVEDSEVISIVVQPEVRTAPAVFLKGAPQTLGQGNFDVRERGTSVNFMGIREYHFGDPVKLISWKLSAKHHRFLVKEFEKSVNAEVSLIVDLRPQLHVGVADKNSWDLCKEIAICILESQIRQGNAVQTISQNLLTPFENTMGAKDTVLLRLMSETPKEGRDVFDAALKLSPPRSTVVYVAPFFPDSFQEIEGHLLRLHAEGRNVVIVLVDSTPFVNSQIIDLESVVGVSSEIVNRKRLNEFVSRWNLLGLTVYFVKNPSAYERDLIRPYHPEEHRVGTSA